MDWELSSGTEPDMPSRCRESSLTDPPGLPAGNAKWALRRQAPSPLPSLHPLTLTSLVRPRPLTGRFSALTHRGRTFTPSRPRPDPSSPLQH